MDRLLSSRRKSKDAPEVVPPLSPEKYGKGAYCELNYTPSKLSEHVLWRESSKMRQVEDESSRCRELQSQVITLQDQIDFQKREKNGIEHSLQGMVDMYKQIMAEMETKNEERLRKIQCKFSEEMQKIIEDKEEEAKYFTAQREELEGEMGQKDNVIEVLQA